MNRTKSAAVASRLGKLTHKPTAGQPQAARGCNRRNFTVTGVGEQRNFRFSNDT